MRKNRFGAWETVWPVGLCAQYFTELWSIRMIPCALMAEGKGVGYKRVLVRRVPGVAHARHPCSPPPPQLHTTTHANERAGKGMGYPLT